MNDSVGPELSCVNRSNHQKASQVTHNINGDDSAIEVDSQPSQSDVQAKSLGLVAQGLLIVRSWNGMGNQNPTSRIEVRRNMIEQELLDILL